MIEPDEWGILSDESMAYLGVFVKKEKGVEYIPYGTVMMMAGEQLRRGDMVMLGDGGVVRYCEGGSR